MNNRKRQQSPSSSSSSAAAAAVASSAGGLPCTPPPPATPSSSTSTSRRPLPPWPVSPASHSSPETPANGASGAPRPTPNCPGAPTKQVTSKSLLFYRETDGHSEDDGHQPIFHSNLRPMRLDFDTLSSKSHETHEVHESDSGEYPILKMGISSSPPSSPRLPRADTTTCDHQTNYPLMRPREKRTSAGSSAMGVMVPTSSSAATQSTRLSKGDGPRGDSSCCGSRE